jgi:cyanophycin synthetase
MLPFEDSRRLTGGNLYFASTAAVLEVPGAECDDALIAGWRARVARATNHLGWTRSGAVARRHAGGVALAISAPADQLWVATEVNEWALCATLLEREPSRWRDLEAALIAEAQQANSATANPAAKFPPALEESAALARFAQLAFLESRPRLRALLHEAAMRGLGHVVDDTTLTLGAGVGGVSFSLAALPAVSEVAWAEMRDIPTAIVTGSNGKTTTVRLLAACARSHGWRTAFNCTDGVFLDEEKLVGGDYSGPEGTRRVLREPRAQAAILETARGGILRRGIAVSQVRTAVVTNVSADHFGEYGIHDLAGLADTKLSVAATVAPGGLLILNAEDPQLRRRAETLPQRFGRSPAVGWFSAGADPRDLLPLSANAVAACGVRRGNLYLLLGEEEFDLGAISDMPLSMGGIAEYNVANIAGSALAASALGIAPATIAAVLAHFGAHAADNPGRMMRFEVGGVTILIDYAHNPEGLRGFLKVAARLRGGTGRLGLLLGQAGNRKDSDIRELAQVAAEFRPELVVVKEDEAHLRGRSAAEVPRIIRSELQRLGLPDSALPVKNNEVEAARHALRWARPGDVLALPIHSADARTAVLAMLENPTAS